MRTVTLQDAVLLPSTVVAVIVAVPAFSAVILPFSTVATAVLSDFHVTLLLVAFAGNTVTVREADSPTFRSSVDLFRDTPVTVITDGDTVTVQDAVLFPSSVVTVMVAVPAFSAVTLPLLTVATEVLSDFHVIFLLVAFAGDTVAVRVAESPTFRSKDDLSKEISVTETVVFSVTVI